MIGNITHTRAMPKFHWVLFCYAVIMPAFWTLVRKWNADALIKSKFLFNNAKRFGAADFIVMCVFACDHFFEN